MNKDCFTYNPKFFNSCSALLSAYCLYGNCPFYKTKEQHKADLEKYPLASPRDRHSAAFIAGLVEVEEGDEVW